jgi:hypothetical protein
LSVNFILLIIKFNCRSFNKGYTWFNIIILLFLSKFHPQKTEIFKDNFKTFFLFHCTRSMHLFSTWTGLKVDADNIPELGGFLSQDFGSKYHNLYIKTPCLIPGFQVRGRAHLKKLHRVEGVAKFFGVFRVENHIFFQF